MITLIAAISINKAIGKEGNLLWHLPKDFEHFRKSTMGHVIIMGRKTFESLPKLLPKRKHIIVSKNMDYQPKECIVCHSLDEALEKALEIDENPFVIGGGQIYKATMPLAQKIVLTRVEAIFENADTFFPEIDERIWQKVSEKNFFKDENHNYNFTIETYLRKE